jgi:5-methylcytosine-specific restriction endonuclease McrA
MKGGTQRPRRRFIPFRMRLWIRQYYRCPICTKRIPRAILFSDRLNLDHVVPKSRGGTRDPENLALVHLTCNQAKGSDCPCYWYKGRVDRWKENDHCTPEIHNWKWPISTMEDAIEGEE